MAFSLQGHVALVTGSTTGLGKATALSFAQAGAKVAVNYFRNEQRAEQAIAEFREQGFEPLLVRGDVTNPAEIDRLCGKIEREWGPVDILVCNATPAQPHNAIEDYDWEFHQEMLDFFVKSPFLLAQRVLPGMKEKGWGRIVNITSEVFHRSIAPFSAYVAAKGGQIGWSRSMATELAPAGITVNMVAPGWIPTERHDDDSPDAKTRYLQGIPMGRWGTAKEIADAALYFASEEAGFVTGQTLCVNGGFSPW